MNAIQVGLQVPLVLYITGEIMMIDKETYMTLKRMMEISKILSDGEIEEYYDHPFYVKYPERKPENLPTLMQLTTELEELVNSLSEEMNKKYSDEISNIKYYLSVYKEGQYYEKLNRSGTPKITTVGKRLYGDILDICDRYCCEKPTRTEISHKDAADKINDYMRNLFGKTKSDQD